MNKASGHDHDYPSSRSFRETLSSIKIFNDTELALLFDESIRSTRIMGRVNYYIVKYATYEPFIQRHFAREILRSRET